MTSHDAAENTPDREDLAHSTFFHRVWRLVEEIPPGRVATYGDIAEYLSARTAARAVGWALNAAAGTDVPCHRVVNRKGALTGKRHFEGADVMEERLRSEGIQFTEEGLVDLAQHRWVPVEEMPPASLSRRNLAKDVPEGGK